MLIPLPDNLGEVHIDKVMRCNIAVTANEFFAKAPDIVAKLDPTIKDAITRAIDKKELVALDDTQQMTVGAFFMEVGTFLMQEGMKQMRICGAAYFIPPQRQDE